MLIAILGAGAGSRFGTDKLTANCAGQPLGQWSMEAALGLDYPVVWIGGAERPAFLTSRCSFHPNPKAYEGLSTSLATAAQVAGNEGAPSLLVMLADMPLITVAILKALVRAGPLAACSYRGRLGVPALFPADMFASLEALQGDRGASPLLREATGVVLVTPDPDSLLDVDTQDDLLKAERLLRASSSPPG